MPRISEKTLKVQDSECIDTSCLSVFMCSMMLINTAVISEYNLNIWTFWLCFVFCSETCTQFSQICILFLGFPSRVILVIMPSPESRHARPAPGMSDGRRNAYDPKSELICVLSTCVSIWHKKEKLPLSRTHSVVQTMLVLSYDRRLCLNTFEDPVVCVPSSFFIGENGIPLEVIAGSVSAEELLKRITKVQQVRGAPKVAECRKYASDRYYRLIFAFFSADFYNFYLKNFPPPRHDLQTQFNKWSFFKLRLVTFFSSLCHFYDVNCRN